MSDDIVTRLRAVPMAGNGTCCGLNSTIVNPYYYRCTDAADEIERLRQEIEKWKTVAQNEHYAWSQCKWGCDCIAKAVRGD